MNACRLGEAVKSRGRAAGPKLRQPQAQPPLPLLSPQHARGGLRVKSRRLSHALGVHPKHAHSRQEGQVSTAKRCQPAPAAPAQHTEAAVGASVAGWRHTQDLKCRTLMASLKDWRPASHRVAALLQRWGLPTRCW